MWSTMWRRAYGPAQDTGGATRIVVLVAFWLLAVGGWAFAVSFGSPVFRSLKNATSATGRVGRTLGIPRLF